MKNKINAFVAEAKIYARVIGNMCIAACIGITVYTVVSFFTGKQIAIVEKGDAVLKTGIVTNVEAKK